MTSWHKDVFGMSRSFWFWYFYCQSVYSGILCDRRCVQNHHSVSYSFRIETVEHVSLLWKMVLYQSSQLNAPLPLIITPFDEDRFRCVPLLVMTDYKTQAQTFSEAVLDLVSKGRDSHREFCSFYVQVGRLTSSERLHLLENIRMSYISKKPHPDLAAEMASLQALERQTLARWHTDMMWDGTLLFHWSHYLLRFRFLLLEIKLFLLDVLFNISHDIDDFLGFLHYLKVRNLLRNYKYYETFLTCFLTPPQISFTSRNLIFFLIPRYPWEYVHCFTILILYDSICKSLSCFATIFHIGFALWYP